MAKRRRTTHRRKSVSLSSGGRKRHHRRRRISAGGRGVFKAVSNPIVGGIVGGLASRVITNLAKGLIDKALPAGGNNAMIAELAPVALGLFLRKKMPAVANGLIAVPIVKLIGSKVAFLNEEGNHSFVSERILSDGQPERFLSARNYFLSDSTFRYNMNDGPATYDSAYSF